MSDWKWVLSREWQLQNSHNFNWSVFSFHRPSPWKYSFKRVLFFRLNPKVNFGFFSTLISPPIEMITNVMLLNTRTYWSVKCSISPNTGEKNERRSFWFVFPIEENWFKRYSKFHLKFMYSMICYDKEYNELLAID